MVKTWNVEVCKHYEVKAETEEEAIAKAKEEHDSDIPEMNYYAEEISSD